METETIDTGDTVHHIPSDEEWYVAGVSGDLLYPVGWPADPAKLSDCVLLEKASWGRRHVFQVRLSQLPDSDARKQFGKSDRLIGIDR